MKLLTYDLAANANSFGSQSGIVADKVLNKSNIHTLCHYHAIHCLVEEHDTYIGAFECSAIK